MTTIPAEIYARLTASERIRAAVSAQSRGDTEEIRNLTETAPRKLCQVADPQYRDGLARLVSLAMAVESDLQGHALDFLMAGRLGVTDASHSAVAGAASVESAWQAFLGELGIPADEMASAGPPRHHAVATLLELAAGEADAVQVEAITSAMREYFQPDTQD